MHRLKTGALIQASVRWRRLCASGSAGRGRRALDGYAQDIGLAFQIQDDILDVEGNTLVLGKTVGADAALAKPTYTSLLGLEGAKERAGTLKTPGLRASGNPRGRAHGYWPGWPRYVVIVEFSHPSR